MPEPVWIDAAALRAAVPIELAIDALEDAWGSDPPPTAPERTSVAQGDGTLLLMPAVGTVGAGVKLVTVQPGNPARGLPLIHGVYVLFDAETLAPVAFIDGAELTRIRTPAVSALATRHLARPEADRLVVFGSGVQAHAHVAAMRAVRPIDEVVIVDPRAEAAQALVAQLALEGVPARTGTPHDVAGADVVCTCTSASAPLFDGALLAPGVHVNAMGAYQPYTREIDTAAIQRATVVVETRAAALAEAGDLLIPIAEGAIAPDHIAGELADVVCGTLRRRDADEITLLKSVGVASEDLVVAAAALARVRG